MRILMVSDVYFPRINGVSTSIETFRRELLAQGADVRLIAPAYQGEANEPGIIRVPGRPVPRDPEDRLASYRKMRKAVREAAWDCDLIHIQTPFVAHYAGLAAARTWGIPAIATYHTLFEEYLQHYAPFMPAHWLKGLARRLSRGQCNALDAIVAPSTAMQARLRDYGVSVPIHVLPTGIPLERFAAGNGRRFREMRGIAPERPVALFVGRVAHEKNIGMLLEAVSVALREIPDLLLLITGEGPAQSDLRRQARILGIQEHVAFLGYLDRQRELPDCYAAADAFVFASRTETQGLVLLEAMAMGLPVVALSAMGTADILEEGRGCIVAEDHPVAVGKALAGLLSDPVLRSRLADEARDYAREWSDRAMARKLLGLYERVTTGQTTLGVLSASGLAVDPGGADKPANI